MNVREPITIDLLLIDSFLTNVVSVLILYTRSVGEVREYTSVLACTNKRDVAGRGCFAL